MLKEYRQKMLAARNKVDKLKSDLERIKESGLSQEKINKDRKSAIEAAQAELRAGSKEMEGMMQVGYINSVKNAENVRRGNEKQDNTAKLFHQQHAAMMLRGLEPEEAVEQFDSVISGLPDDERGFKWIYEDILKSSVRDDSHKYIVEKTIDKHRTPEEREALQEARKMQTMIENDKTFRGLLELDLKDISQRGTRAELDYAQVFDDMVKKASGQATDIANLRGVKEAISSVFGEDTIKETTDIDKEDSPS